MRWSPSTSARLCGDSCANRATRVAIVSFTCAASPAMAGGPASAATGGETWPAAVAVTASGIPVIDALLAPTACGPRCGPYAWLASSFVMDARRRDDVAIARHFGPQQRAQRSRGTGRWLNTNRRQRLPVFGHRGDGGDVARDRVYRRARRARRR